MIKENAITASMNYAGYLSSNNKAIQPISNTPMAELVRLSNLSTIESLVLDEKEFGHYVETATTNRGVLIDESRPSMHDCYMNSIINDISKATLTHISFAKNVAVPIIEAYSTAVSSALESIKNSSPTSLFSIELIDIPDLFGDRSFTALFDRYNSKTPVIPNFSVEIATEYLLEKMIEMMHFGESGLDHLIDTWYASKPPSLFAEIWNTFFGFSHEMNLLNKLETSGVRFYEKIDIGLALYLLGRKLYDQPEATRNAIPLSNYREKVSAVRDFGGALVSSNLLQYKLIEKGSFLVIDINEKAKSCTVAGPIYRDWLSKNGAPEILFGLIISGNYYRTIEKIDDNRDALLSQWATYSGISKATEINLQFKIFVSVLETEFLRLMSALTDEEKTYEMKYPNYRTLVKTYLEEELKNTTKQDMVCIYKTAKRIICKARLYYTGSNEILSSIEDSEFNNPSISPREAALIATIYYIADYITQQLVIEQF
jgi:hypothetical protein